MPKSYSIKLIGKKTSADFINAFLNIPTDWEEIHLDYQDLTSSSPQDLKIADLKKAFISIRSHVTSLVIHNINLNENIIKAGRAAWTANIINILTYIPPNITSLTLSFNKSIKKYLKKNPSYLKEHIKKHRDNIGIRLISSPNSDKNTLCYTLPGINEIFSIQATDTAEAKLIQKVSSSINHEKLIVVPIEKIERILNAILDNCGEKLIDKLVTHMLETILKAIPKHVTSLTLQDYLLTNTKLAMIINTISENITTLNLMNNDLQQIFNDLTIEELKVMFETLSSNVISLNLARNGFGLLDGTKLEAVCLSLPDTLRILNLSRNDLQRLGHGKLAEVFRSLPKMLKHLDLHENYFRLMEKNTSITEMIALFNNISDNVSSINISESIKISNCLNPSYLSEEYAAPMFTISDMIKITPKHITTLDFTASEFPLYCNDDDYKKSKDILCEAFKDIPLWITTLNLSKNNLNCYFLHITVIARLQAAFKAIANHQITTLNLSDNNLGEKLSWKVFKSLSYPPKAELDHLRNSFVFVKNAKLYYISSDKKRIKVSISDPKLFKEELTQLVKNEDVSYGLYTWNQNYGKTYSFTSDTDFKKLGILDSAFLPNKLEILKTFVKTIPASVKILNLSHNALGKLSITELLEVLKAIPQTVTTIDLRYNGLFIGKTLEERDTLLIALQELCKPISSNNNHRNDKQIEIKPNKKLIVNQTNHEPSKKTNNSIEKSITKRSNITMFNFSSNTKGRSISHKAPSSTKSKKLAKQQPSPSKNIDISHNGEASFARAFLPLLSAAKQCKITFDVACLLLQHLLPEDNPTCSYTTFVRNEANNVLSRKNAKNLSTK